jgi:hypothetical protein
VIAPSSKASSCMYYCSRIWSAPLHFIAYSSGSTVQWRSLRNTPSLPILLPRLPRACHFAILAVSVELHASDISGQAAAIDSWTLAEQAREVYIDAAQLPFVFPLLLASVLSCLLQHQSGIASRVRMSSALVRAMYLPASSLLTCHVHGPRQAYATVQRHHFCFWLTCELDRRCRQNEKCLSQP